MKKSGLWKMILKFTNKYRKNLVISAIFSFMTGIVVAVLPLIIKYIVDNGIQNTALTANERLKTVFFFSILYIGLYCFRLVAWGISYRNMLLGLEGFLFNIRSKFFSHVQTLCMRFYDKTSSGELFNYIMGTPMASLKTFLQQFALGVPYQVVSLVISLAAMISFDWLLTLVLLLIVLVSIVVNKMAGKRIKNLSGDLLKSESEASKYIDDVLHGSSAIKMYAIEDNINLNFEKYMETLKKKGISLSFTNWVEAAKPEFMQHVGVVMIYVVGAFSCIYRGLTVGELIAFVNSMNIIMSSLNSFFNINLIRSNAEAGLDRIMSVLNSKTTTPEKTEHLRDIKLEKKRAEEKDIPCIEFCDVTFGYDKKRIFENFSCRMEYNKSFGLVGSSGSGKSTIVKLIMRLYDVDDGKIMLHGRNINDFSLHDLRTSIGIVPQEPFIFHTSIIENIRIACPNAPMQEIIKAMEVARVHEFVNDLPLGWNTIVGEGGYGLSGGQKQRIAIARAILGNPDILIFDEATSALDNISERHIQNAMEELMKYHMVIIIAHRLTTIKNVDEILVFDKGKIIQKGNFKELSENEGAFKNMLNSSTD